MTAPLSLDTYRLLGNSGLRVSPLCLGTMTFGETWGADECESRRIFDSYVDLGGNFIDTAGYYAHGRSEELTGRFAEARRDALVLATKYSLAAASNDPNAAGNGRKSMIRAVEQSLRRLKTDHIDLLFLHAWDDVTPVAEILRAFDDLVSQGKILYIGVSDTPAWQIARMEVTAELRGWTRFIALQAEYSLIQRTAERDLIPAAKTLGLGVMPWSPLASGILSGRYATDAQAPTDPDGGRAAMLVKAGRVNPTAVRIADTLKVVAEAVGATSAQVAIAWTLSNPAVTAPLLGARTLRQLTESLGALDVQLDAEHLAELDGASRIELGFPHDFLRQPFIRTALTGGTTVLPRA